MPSDRPSHEDASTIASPARTSGRGMESRFLPGTVLDRRYRIVAPLGRGGMGEVYRADDIKLGQPVALKFLPRALEKDPQRMALLLDEVKLARQVSHPNVCRVWDAGESEGLHFLAMEYVDGEDLGSLLRRIGRLPEDRAVQVARELCAGLAAVHDQGLLHRDLKPANVMLDGRGRVRITDFGLAALDGSIGGGDVRAGTPAYMAPEQREGREVSVRSDVYSLGLVLYEIFTGRSAFEGVDPSSRSSDSMPASPTSHVRTLDPIVERAILRCLEPDPAQRPSSALAVARSLPGGDPLAVALAAGETPSPEMVAAAGGVGGLHPAVAVAIVVLVFGCILGVLALSERRGVPFAPGDKPYAALRDRASEFAQAVGVTADADDVGDGYSMTDAEPDSAAGGGRFYYWYRRSPAALLDVLEERISGQPNTFAVPALEVPGESAQRRALDGHLLEYRRIPLTRDSALAGPVDYEPFFTAAGLASAPRTPAPARIIPPVPAQAESAWTIATESGPQRVEAAAHAGRVTFFAVGPPYSPRAVKKSDLVASTLGSLVVPVLFFISLFFARRNLLIGRADGRGAIRLGIVSAVIGILGFRFLARPEIPLPGSLLIVALAMTLFYSGFTTSAYLALEPVVRRRHPGWLASWNRLLDGRWLDPLVGRDVLFGTLGGTALALIGAIRGLFSGTPPLGDVQAAAVGGWTALAVILRGANTGLLGALIFVLMLVVLQNATRRERLGWIAWWLLATWFWAGNIQPTLLWAPALQTLVLALLMTRSGLAGVAIAITLHYMFNEECHTLRLDAWYANVTLACLLAVGALVVWGLVAATRAPRGARTA